MASADQQHVVPALQRACEADQTLGFEGVHEPCMLVPQRLLAERAAMIPLRAVGADDGEPLAHRSFLPPPGCMPRRQEPVSSVDQIFAFGGATPHNGVITEDGYFNV